MKTIHNTVRPFKKFKVGEIVWAFKRRKTCTLQRALREEPRWLVSGYERCPNTCEYCGSDGWLMILTSLQRDESYLPRGEVDTEPLWVVNCSSQIISPECPAYRTKKRRYFRYCKIGKTLSWEKLE